MSLTNPFQGGTIHDMEAFIAETLASGSTAANPRPVTAKAVAELVHQITCT
jgi:alcohol dehydrogenase class IV